uniref:Uncharacterized protein n=1 Tax=Panagrellus redivivus TaxID=6233 RepID=A0A7E4ZYQ9_PANRE
MQHALRGQQQGSPSTCPEAFQLPSRLIRAQWTLLVSHSIITNFPAIAAAKSRLHHPTWQLFVQRYFLAPFRVPSNVNPPKLATTTGNRIMVPSSRPVHRQRH